MKIIAMITARSTSSRFPRKHLADLGGKPMIVQMIEKLQELIYLDEIVIATTINKEDDDLSKISKAAGAEVIRGSEGNIASRHGLVLSHYNPDAVMDISGDCPFIDVRGMQMLLTAMNNYPDYDCYGISGPYSMLPGILTGGHSKTWYEKAFRLFSNHHTKYSADQYWLATREAPEQFSTYTVDGSRLMDKTSTPMKLSIDWDIERQFWNKIIDCLGFYPQTMIDINSGFRMIKEL